MDEEVTELLVRVAQWLLAARRIVCLTGAGVSAESGVATFRDAQTGLWSRFDPQQLASQEGFAADPGVVWRWYMHRLTKVERVQPNAGHRALAQMEAERPNFTLVTQNVDDLHERAGSRHVLHLHGHISRFHCNRCTFQHDLTPADRESLLPPRCTNCGGYVRPSVVWFGEPLPDRVLNQAWRDAERCDIVLVVGTSGVVYPAAELPFLARHAGARIVEVNPDFTPVSEIADAYLAGLSGTILPQIVEAMHRLESS